MMKGKRRKNKVVTKAEKFRITGQNKMKHTKDMLEDEDSKNNKQTTEKPSRTAAAGKPKESSKMPSSKRKTVTTAKATKPSKDDKKKSDIYEAMKGVGFGVPQPKIATNKTRAYKY
jgi:hypothetical protein